MLGTSQAALFKAKFRPMTNPNNMEVTPAPLSLLSLSQQKPNAVLVKHILTSQIQVHQVLPCWHIMATLLDKCAVSQVFCCEKHQLRRGTWTVSNLCAPRSVSANSALHTIQTQQPLLQLCYQNISHSINHNEAWVQGGHSCIFD